MLHGSFWVIPRRLNVFRNVGVQNSSAGELPRRKHKMFILSEHKFNFNKIEKFHKMVRESKDLLLNTLLSDCLELSADFVIKLYIGIRDTSLCL